MVRLMTTTYSPSPENLDNGSAEPEQRESPQTSTGKAWVIVAAVISQTTILVALLYRVGWIRANATAEYFGLDITLVGLAPSDYLLRSLNSIIRPLLVFSLCTVAFFAITGRLTRFLSSVPRARRRQLTDRILRTARPVGGTLLLIGIAGILTNSLPHWPAAILLPLAVFAGAAILGYSAHLSRQSMNQKSVHHLHTLTVIILCCMGLMLAVEKYAEHVGRNIAVDDARALLQRPEIRLHSKNDIDIVGTGVSLSHNPSPEQKFHYRYDGLRLLLQGNNHLFLVSKHWERGKSKVFIVKNDDTVRIDPTASSSGN
ncbi:hypothetical protein ACFWMR_20775 [Amycolatopsis thailandensis]|uniref:hypothetical protein n=1 Tax=Amycolatopsis thailandensis TaxID=589330 RepID=UPI00364950F5